MPTPPFDIEAIGSGSTSLLPYYVPPRPMEEPKVTFGKNSKYQLVTPAILIGVHVMVNIIPNLQKMGFIGHDLRKFPELDMKQYMTTV